MQLAATQTPSFSQFHFQSIGQSQSDNVPDLLRRISSVDPSGSYDYDDQLSTSGQSMAEEIPDVEMSEFNTADSNVAAFSTIPQRPSLMQALTMDSAHSPTVDTTAPPRSKVDIFQKIDLRVPTPSPESSSSGAQRQVLRASSSRSSPGNLVYPSEPLSLSQTHQEGRPPFIKSESSRAVPAIVSPPLPLNEHNTNAQPASTQLVTATPAIRPYVLKDIHSRLEQTHSGSESSSSLDKISSALDLSRHAEALAQKSQEFAQTASLAAAASLNAATEARKASVQATAVLRGIKEDLERQEAQRIDNLEGVKMLGEYITNRDMILQKRRDEKEANEKSDRLEKDKLVREEEIRRKEEEEKNAKVRSEAQEQIRIQNSTAHSSPSISNLPANDDASRTSPKVDIPSYLQSTLLLAFESIDGSTLQQILEDKRAKEQETRKDLIAEQWEQSKLKKAAEVERRRNEELKRAQDREEVAAKERKVLEVAEEQKRKAAGKVEQTGITQGDDKRAQLDRELAELEEARKRVQEEQRRRDIVRRKSQAVDGRDGSGSLSINTTQSTNPAALRGPIALIDSPTLPLVATLPSRASNASQSPTIQFSASLPASLPPKPRSTIPATVTTNVVAKQVLIPSQKAKDNARKSEQPVQAGVISGNVSLGPTSPGQAARNADVGVRSKTNPHPSKGASSFAESERNDGASSCVDSPLLHSSSLHNTGNLSVHPRAGPSSTSPGVHASNVRFVTGPKLQVDKPIKGSAGPKIKAEEDESNLLQPLTQSTSKRPTPSAPASASLPPQAARTVPQPATFVSSPSVPGSSTQPTQTKALNQIKASPAGTPAPPKQPAKDAAASTTVFARSTPTATVPPPSHPTRTIQSTDVIVPPVAPAAGGSSQHSRQKIPNPRKPNSTPASSTSAPPKQLNAALTTSAPKNVTKTQKPPVSPVASSNRFLPRPPSPISPGIDGGDGSWINPRGRSRNRFDRRSPSPYSRKYGYGYDHYSPPRHSLSPRSYSPRSPRRSPSPVRTRTTSRSRSPARHFSSGSARSLQLSSASPRRSFSPATAPARKNRKRPAADNSQDLPPRKRTFSHQTDSGNNDAYSPTLGLPAADYMEPYTSSPYGLQSDSLPPYNNTILGARLSSALSAPNDDYSFSDSSTYPFQHDRDYGESDEQYNQYTSHQSHQLPLAKRLPGKRQRHSTNDQPEPLLVRLGISPQVNTNPTLTNARGRGHITRGPTVRGQARGGRGRGRGRGQPRDNYRSQE